MTPLGWLLIVVAIYRSNVVATTGGPRPCRICGWQTLNGELCHTCELMTGGWES